MALSARGCTCARISVRVLDHPLRSASSTFRHQAAVAAPFHANLLEGVSLGIELRTMSEERHRWISYIKQLRQERDVGIFEAERIALARPEWRRWVERQINSDIACRKSARHHMQ